MKNKSIIKFYIYNFFINLAFVEAIQTIYFQHIGISFANIAFLFAILQIGKLLFEIPTGYIADRFGKKVSVATSIVLTIAAYIITGFSRSYSLFIIAMIILSISYTLTTGAVDALLIDVCLKDGTKEDLSKVNSINRIIYYVSFGISALLSGVIASYSFKIVYSLNISTLFLSLICLVQIQEEKKNNTNNEEKKYSVSKISKYIFTNKHLFYFILIELAISLAMIPIDRFYSNYLVIKFDMNIKQVGVIVCIQFMLCSFTGLLSNKVSKEIGSTKLVRFGPIVMMVLFMGFAVVRNEFLCIVSYFAALCIFCLYSPVKYKLMQINIISDYRATVISFKSIMMALLASFTQPIFGFISDKFDMRIAIIVLLIVSISLIFIINLIFYKLEFE